MRSSMAKAILEGMSQQKVTEMGFKALRNSSYRSHFLKKYIHQEVGAP
jgi:hypothetical protein